MYLSHIQREKSTYSQVLLFKAQAKNKDIRLQNERKQVWHDTVHNWA